MNRSLKTLNITVIILLAVILAADLTAAMTGALSAPAVTWIALGAAAAGLAVLAFANYSHSRYGGKFHQHYPDSHTG